MCKFLQRSIALMFVAVIFMLHIPTANAQVYTSTVKRVVDGDTIHLNQPVLGTTKVRLLSIDTPETNFQGKNQGEHAFAATNHLSQLLPPGSNIKIELGTEQTDQHGRLLAHIYKGNLDINKEMVRKGYAVTYFIYPNLSHFGEYQSALVQARSEGLGIWNLDSPLELLPFEFRIKVSNGVPNKWVVDSHTKMIYQPNEYHKVPVERRIFFMTEQDAESAIDELIDK